MSSDYFTFLVLLSECQVDLLHFTWQKEVPHNIRLCSMAFVFSVFEDLNIPALIHFRTFQRLDRRRTSYQQIQPARIGCDWLKILHPFECRSLSTLN
ncbi:hypothetical protein AVEN_169340-1 [Araneus ventricosus]|uniref:Uncharacterized protein n=1 Tax=Araneus ventricosus TaxID=182803 RepID=A0A4Y2WJG5_ARAVE|nr:hypothetical protein AVEN_169340-1 [Araneus ventricosus]